MRECFVDEAGAAPRARAAELSHRHARSAIRGWSPACNAPRALAQWDGGAPGTRAGAGLPRDAIGRRRWAGSRWSPRATRGEGGVRVTRLSAAVDIGRVVNRDIALQQIEGGLVFGLGLALGCATGYVDGLPTHAAAWRRWPCRCWPIARKSRGIDGERGRTVRSRRDRGASGRPGSRQCAVFRHRPAPAPVAADIEMRPELAPPITRRCRRGKVGVLLVNLGTPDAPTPAAVKRYLAEFLSDRRVVELPALAVAADPARDHPQHPPEEKRPCLPPGVDRRGLAARRDHRSASAWRCRRGWETACRWTGRCAMAIRRSRASLQALKDRGCDRILLAPLYPQYCGATTATVVDKAGDALADNALAARPAQPCRPITMIRCISPRWRLTSGAQLDALAFQPEVLLLQLPRHARSARWNWAIPITASAARPRGCWKRRWPGPDLRIATSSSAASAGPNGSNPQPMPCWRQRQRSGTRRLAIAAPGFSADCLETLEELAIRGREQFLGAGGERLRHARLPQRRRAGMAMLEALVRRELAGWV